MVSLEFKIIITALSGLGFLTRIMIAIPIVDGLWRAHRRRQAPQSFSSINNSPSIAKRIYVCNLIFADIAEFFLHKSEYCVYAILDICWPFGQLSCQLSLTTARWVFTSVGAYFVCAIVLSKARFSLRQGSLVAHDYVREAKFVSAFIWTACLLVIPPLANVQLYTGKSVYYSKDIVIRNHKHADDLGNDDDISGRKNGTRFGNDTYEHWQCYHCKGEYNQNQWVDLSIHVIAEFIPVVIACIGTIILCWQLYLYEPPTDRQWSSTKSNPPTCIEMKRRSSSSTATIASTVNDQKQNGLPPPHPPTPPALPSSASTYLQRQQSAPPAHQLRHSNVSTGSNTTTGTNSTVLAYQNVRYNTILISFFTALIFLICNTPGTVREIVNCIAPDRYEPDWSKRFVMCAAFAHPLLSSLLYLYMLKAFGSFSNHITQQNQAAKNFVFS